MQKLDPEKIVGCVTATSKFDSLSKLEFAVTHHPELVHYDALNLFFFTAIHTCASNTPYINLIVEQIIYFNAKT